MECCSTFSHHNCPSRTAPGARKRRRASLRTYRLHAWAMHVGTSSCRCPADCRKRRVVQPRCMICWCECDSSVIRTARSATRHRSRADHLGCCHARVARLSRLDHLNGLLRNLITSPQVPIVDNRNRPHEPHGGPIAEREQRVGLGLTNVASELPGADFGAERRIAYPNRG
jgi:hypothetical protein